MLFAGVAKKFADDRSIGFQAWNVQKPLFLFY